MQVWKRNGVEDGRGAMGGRAGGLGQGGVVRCKCAQVHATGGRCGLGDEGGQARCGRIHQRGQRGRCSSVISKCLEEECLENSFKSGMEWDGWLVWLSKVSRSAWFGGRAGVERRGANMGNCLRGPRPCLSRHPHLGLAGGRPAQALRPPGPQFVGQAGV